MPEQHNIYKAILDSAQENVVLLDDAYKVICFNTAIQNTLRSYFGKDINEGDDYRNFVVPASLPLFLSTFQKAMNGEICLVEHETIGEGFSIWFQYKMNPVIDVNGVQLGILLSAKDISIQKKAEISLQQNEEKFRKIFESAVNPILIIDPLLRITMVNPELEKTFFYTSQEIIGQNIENLIPDFNSVCYNKYLHGLQTNAHQEYSKVKGNIKALRKDGLEIVVEIGFNIIEVNQGQYVMVMIRDVTDQIIREKQLKKANHQLVLLNKVNDIVNRETDQEQMLWQVNKCIITDGGYKLVWIGKYPEENDPEQIIAPLYAYGETAYLNEIHISVKEAAQQAGPTITCLKSGKPVITNNLSAAENFLPWLSAASKYGIQASLVLPIDFRGMVACINIYAQDRDAFDEEEVNILLQIANIISRTIAGIQLRDDREAALFQLNERVKEMRTIHVAESLLKDETLSSSEIMSAFTKILPQGWQYPDRCFVHIHFSDQDYYSVNYQKTGDSLVEKFETFDGKTGWIEIGYVKTSAITDRIFLPEEVQLLHTITEMFVVYYNKSFAMQALRKTQANLLTIFNNTDIGYLLLDNNMLVLEYNTTFYKEYERVTGSKVKKGVSWQMLTDKAGKVFSEEIAEALFVRKKPVVYDTYYNVNGEDNYFTITLSPILQKSELIGFVEAAINITEKKINELERQKLIGDLIQRNRDLEQFAYIVSHNLRAPVANIIGLTELAARKNQDEESLPVIIAGLSESASKLDAVIIDLDQTLRIRRQIIEKKEFVDFQAILNDVLKEEKNQIKATNALIHVQFGKAPSMITVRSYMFNIFTNIIKNSIRFCRKEERPIIDIWSEIDENLIKIHFKDNGTGIDTIKYRDQIFGLYKRFHPDIQGRGIGLFMVKHQVEALNGTIELNSKPGIGTHIVITFAITK